MFGFAGYWIFREGYFFDNFILLPCSPGLLIFLFGIENINININIVRSIFNRNCNAARLV